MCRHRVGHRGGGPREGEAWDRSAEGTVEKKTPSSFCTPPERPTNRLDLHVETDVMTSYREIQSIIGINTEGFNERLARVAW